MNTRQTINDLSKPIIKNNSGQKRWWHTSGFVFLLVIGLLLATVTAAQALVAGYGFMWTVDPNAPVELKVCWLNPDYAEPLTGEADQTSGWQRREWVKLALKHTWEREARIIFTGWETCNESIIVPPPETYGPRRPGTQDENLKILITDEKGGQNPGHGSWGDYMSPGIILNLHHANQAWYEYLAIHEFGHALGLYHGEERSDWPLIPGCPKQDWEENYPWWPIAIAELQWGAPDRDSVMAYCSGGPNELSPTDIAGIQRAYGRHIPGTLLSLPASLCLAAHADAANGADAFGWACDEANDDQEWKYDAVNQALYIQSPGDLTRRCLDVDTLNYSDVQIWDCLYGANQQWQFRQVVVRGYGGLCLTRPSRSGGGALTMQTCTGASSQLWNVEKGQVTGRVRLVSTDGNLCLTKDGDSGSDAMALPCNMYFTFLPLALDGAASGQVASQAAVGYTPADVSNWVRDFRLDEGGSIQFPSRVQSLCLDVQDVWDYQFTDGQGGPKIGQRVQFFDCHDPQINQKWSFSGHLQSGNKCLSLAGSATNNGAKALVESCSSEAQQDWDYDW
jgi:hypothetical protein